MDPLVPTQMTSPCSLQHTAVKYEDLVIIKGTQHCLQTSAVKYIFLPMVFLKRIAGFEARLAAAELWTSVNSDFEDILSSVRCAIK